MKKLSPNCRCCASKALVVKYKEGYEVKFTFIVYQITECEGGGWFSVIGHDISCRVARIKFVNQYPKEISQESDLCDKHLKEYVDYKAEFEKSRRHFDWLNSNCTIKNNNIEKSIHS